MMTKRDFLISQFGDHTHSKNYQHYSEYLAISGTLNSILFNLGEWVAQKAFEPVDGYLATLVDDMPDDKNPKVNNPLHDEMDDIITDTNQQSFRTIPDVPSEPIPVITTSLMLTAKSGNNKSGEKIPPSQPKGGKDQPNSGQKSHDKKSQKIEKVIVMQEFPVHLKNSIRDVSLYDIPVEWSHELLTHLTIWAQS
ncbi:hypothetical protein RclHR1_10720006 [Rhizophagus clarus]|uniref:Uncharacterized protein n=1 Tax=Rhizophagus clarus TaxID=94130 RepID=A0A2Z6Q3X8_9GLOM|nr:hypothetical protein RclHR1_10720006 [Rhizophagus clarus]GES94943.1 hypothetical protein RCL_jg19161.t1 [Rhizophagus clarus]